MGQPLPTTSPALAEQGKIVTSNMWLAAAIIAAGRQAGTPARIDPTGCDRSDPKRVRLCITGPAELLRKVETEWWGGDCIWRVFSEAFRDVRFAVQGAI